MENGTRARRPGWIVLSRPLCALSFEYVPATRQIALACINRLAQLGNYEYNWSQGEQHRWQSMTWLTPQQMIAELEKMPVSGDSGDVYARIA